MKRIAQTINTNRNKLGKVLHGLFILTVVLLLPLWGLLRWSTTLIGNDPRTLTEVKSSIVDIAEMNPFEEPLISITFDDGWLSVYEEAFPIMQKYGICSTQYVISGVSNQTNYMSVEQIRQMQLYCHDIESHTVSHRDLTQLSLTDMESEIQDSKVTLTELYGSVRDFASPESSYDDDVLKVVRKVYRSHRNTNVDLKTVGLNDLNLNETFDRFNINGYSVRRTTTPDQISSYINAAKNHNAWIVLVYHQIDNTEGYFGVAPDVFEQQMGLVKDSGIKIITVSDFMNVYDRKIAK